MTPIDALRREVSAEIDALERRIGSGSLPTAIEIRVEFDRQSGLPHDVEVREDRRRRVISGGTIATRAKRCESAA